MEKKRGVGDLLIGTGALCGLGGVEAAAGGGGPLSEGRFMSPRNHQVLNSTIRSCYFVAVLRHKASTASQRGQSGGGHPGPTLEGDRQTQNSRLFQTDKNSVF